MITTNRDTNFKLFFDELQTRKAYDITPDRDKFTNVDIERAFEVGWDLAQQALREQLCTLLGATQR